MSFLTKPRVVLDTNIFISGFFWKGSPAKIIKLWQQEKIIVFLSPGILAEIILVLKRFNLKNSQIKKFKFLLENNSFKIIPKKKTRVCSDPKDNKFLALSWEVKADYLITGDKKHLLPLKTFKTTNIVTPQQFLKLTSKRF